MTIHPQKLSAAVSSEVYGEDKSIIYNTSGIPAEADWEKYQIAHSKPQVKKTGNECNCVEYAWTKGLKLSGYLYAKYYPINSKIPAECGFVVTYEGPYGHIAYYCVDGSDLVLDEANYSECEITYGRRLDIQSSLIKGYIN